jgi:FHS family L-fucose permease-like MFS transporter
MVAAFKSILLISNFESSLVQAAFYGGYCFMAIPAALFIKRFSYKAGILLGLTLYAVGCLMFIPSGNLMAFWAFLISYFVMTCGLSFLETSANPYILAMGDDATATQRLNFAQAFNPLGSIAGILVAKNIILARLNKAEDAERAVLRDTDATAFTAIQKSDLDVLIMPYAVLGIFVLVVLIAFAIAKLPEVAGEEDKTIDALPTLARLFHNKRYMEGVVAQAFYVGAQIMCWTFIVQYGVNELGMTKAQAAGYSIFATITFVTSRFACTYLLKFFSPGRLLFGLSLGGIILLLGTIFLSGTIGLYCLIAVSACMSLMFPTIYGIALDGLGDDAKLGSAGLIVAIGGGCLMPPMQGWIIDQQFDFLSATRISFVLPLICFVAIAIYGIRTYRIHHEKGEKAAMI